MSINNGFKVGSSFEGHALALSALALLRYGKLVNWDDDTVLDRVQHALVETGDLHLIAMLNESNAFQQGAKQLDELGEAGGKEHYLKIVTATVGGLLQEWGGTLGIEHRNEVARKAIGNVVMRDLHGQDLSGNKVAFDSFTQRAFDGDPLAAMKAAVAQQHGIDPSHVVAIDGDKDIDAQLEGMNVPEEVKSTLRAIGEAAKGAINQAGDEGDATTAETLRKQGKLN